MGTEVRREKEERRKRKEERRNGKEEKGESDRLRLRLRLREGGGVEGTVILSRRRRI